MQVESEAAAAAAAAAQVQANLHAQLTDQATELAAAKVDAENKAVQVRTQAQPIAAVWPLKGLLPYKKDVVNMSA